MDTKTDNEKDSYLLQLQDKLFCKAEMERLCCVVIIPTFNNAASLAAVIEGVKNYTDNILVVNDGSTDGTAALLNDIAGIHVIAWSANKGKGYGLRKGFEKAVSLGFHYAITIDSDGQHSPDDIPAFLAGHKEMPEAIIIGARNMDQAGVPRKSSFGNRFSNFWFRFETGIRIPDTQSGYRFYPLERLKTIHFFTRKYEFEIEVIVRAAWKGVKVVSVPVSIFYAPKETRVSHFRPFRDFTRVSLLNTALVIISLLLIKPFYFVKVLNRKKIRDFFVNEVLASQDSNAKITFSVMLGMFMGIVPLWGWQMAVALVLAMALKLNKVITLVVSNVSIPPMIPFIVYGSYKMGGLVWIKNRVMLEFSTGISLKTIQLNVLQYLIGSVMLAVAMGILSGIVTIILLKIFRKGNVVKVIDR
ncbi:MAG: DUF2062 domain-containing protein [Bacteroidota bacterium]